MESTARFCLALPGALLTLLLAAPAHAAELEASDGTANNLFGAAVSLSDGTAIVGAYRNTPPGEVYLFPQVDTATGTVHENAKLISSDAASGDYFGYSVSQSGTTAIVGAYLAKVGSAANQGAAYIFRNTENAAGDTTEDLKLISSDGAVSDQFGSSVSLSGNNALVGAKWADVYSSNQGAAYFYRSIDAGSGTVTQDVKLFASDGMMNDSFGTAVSLQGTTAIVGSTGYIGGQGAAYLYRIANNASGTITEGAKLTASDATAGDLFGNSVSQSGTTALIGAHNATVGTAAKQGAAYLYRNTDSAENTVTQNVKLIASDGIANDFFGVSVDLSGTTALIGARGADITFSNQGAAYLYRIANNASGTITESVKLTASDAALGDVFGFSVSVNGDEFVIGAMMGDGEAVNSGKAYSGSVSSVTTLDAGDTVRVIDGISFTSREDWIIGQNTSGNEVTLSSGDSANVTSLGKEVYIGQNAGADDNMLFLAGTLVANEVNIGSLAGNAGNTLWIEGTAAFSSTTFSLAPQNFLAIEGDYTDIGGLLTFLGGSSLQAWDDTHWTTVDANNYEDFITLTDSSGYTIVTAIPEPSSVVLLLLGAGGLLLRSRAVQIRKPVLG